jgi:serine phosphatase RsbU (regulator of sigma subunit)
VGGDFYDGFTLGGNEWAMVIGDVCGKGAEAAAITALARYTARAAVLHSRRPARVLGELNEALLRQQIDYRFCTVAFAGLHALSSGSFAVRLAAGGHPLPLILRADGLVEYAGAPGTLLGILSDPDLPEREVVLDPGDAMILYTDGVIEASPVDDALGPEAFAAYVAELAGRSADAIAQSINDVVLSVQGGGLRDDVALLVLWVLPR